MSIWCVQNFKFCSSESILRYQSDVYLLTYFIYCHDKPQNWCQNHIKIMISFGCHICDISVMSISWHKNLGSKFWYQFDINLTSRFVLVTYQWRVDVKVTLNWPKSDVLYSEVTEKCKFCGLFTMTDYCGTKLAKEVSARSNYFICFCKKLRTHYLVEPVGPGRYQILSRHSSSTQAAQAAQ